MNAQSNQLEYAFKRSGIPYKVIGGMQFFERAEVKDMLAYLCVINNPADDLRLSRIINTPTRGIGQKTLETARDIALSENVPIFEILKRSETYEVLKKSAGRLHLFVNIIEDLRALVPETPLDVFYDLLLERSGYIRALEEKESEENLNRIENVSELKSNIVAFVKETAGGSLSDFLSEIALYTDIQQYNSDDDYVVMMTMHSAKGLEFPTVFIVGAEEGIFPGIRAIGELPEMEEERRLCYVAMTRAKEKLVIACAQQRMLFGRTAAGSVSRFVEEIPDENIVRPPVKKSAYGYGGHERYSVSGSGDRSSSKLFQSDGRKQSTEKKTVPVFAKGDAVQHKAFGRGIVTSIQPVGGDALLEVAFDDAGTKRLMLKAAANHMTKI